MQIKILHWLTKAFITLGKPLNLHITKLISTPTRNDEFGLPDGSYYVSDRQDYFEWIIKKTWDCSRKFTHTN